MIGVRENGLNVARLYDEQFGKTCDGNSVRYSKHRHWIQKELANRVDIRFQLLNKYEGGQHIPPAETLIKLAGALDTTVDFLLTGNPIKDEPLASANLFRRFKTLETLNDEDRSTVINVIDAIVAKRQVENVIRPIDQ